MQNKNHSLITSDFDEVKFLEMLLQEACGEDLAETVPNTVGLVTVPVGLVADGFHVGASNDGEFPIEVWLHTLGSIPKAILVDDEEAETLATLIQMASNGFVTHGVLPLRSSGRRVIVRQQYRGKVRVGFDSSRQSAQLKRAQVHSLARELRSAA